MKPGTLILERFDLRPHCSDGETFDSMEALAENATHPPFVTPAEPEPESAPPDEDAEAAKHLVIQLGSVVEAVKADGNAEITRVATEMTEALAQAAKALLPTLIDAHMAKEIAAATVQIALSTKRDDLSLALHPDDHDAVVDQLTALKPPQTLTIATDKTMSPGSARLSWKQGGASIDQATLIASAHDVIATAREKLQSKSTHNDR